MRKRGGKSRCWAGLVGSTALVAVAVSGAAMAADGGVGGIGDGGNGGNGGPSGVAGTPGTGGQGGPGAPGAIPGGAGGAGGTPGAAGFAGGGGGGGADGSAILSFGGAGGNGGNASFGISSGYGGGGGGGGGNGVSVATFPTNDSSSMGGRGGNGGNAAGSPFGAGNGGGGGNGGYGLLVSSSTLTNVAGVTIAGGAGGGGGSGSGMQFSPVTVPGNGGPGGVGGQGAIVDIGTLINRGTIAGGNGGAGGAAGTTGARGIAGAGGVGITGSNVTVVNSGAISGGLSGDGATRANAITFTGGTNVLTIQPGSTITGAVQAFSPADVLAFGGDGQQTFDLTNIGTSAQYRGFGSLRKVDNGTLVLEGSTSFNGPTDVQAGFVEVRGVIPSSAFTLRTGTLLVGTGVIGSLNVQGGARVSPGLAGVPIGTLTVNGNVVFAPGSVYLVNVSPLAGDRIAATGSATLQGGRVEVTPSGASGFLPTQRFTILSARSISGQFAETVVTSSSFLVPSLEYGPDSVSLVLTRNDVSLQSVGQTRNQRAVANALSAVLLGNVLLQDTNSARGALSLLAGEASASSPSTSLTTMLILSSLLSDGGFGDFGSSAGGRSNPFAAFASGASVQAAYAADLPGARPAVTRVPVGGDVDPRAFGVWGSAFGSFGRTTSDGNAGTLTRSTGGFILGAHATIDNMWRIGVAGGYTNTAFDVRSRLSAGQVETGFGALYGGGMFGPVTVRLGVLGAGQSSETRRAVIFPGFTDSLRARFGGVGILGFGELGYRLDLGAVAVEPFLGGAVMRLSRDGYVEQGGPAALAVAGRDYDIQTITAGVRASMALGQDSPFSVRGQLAYRRAFGDVVPRALLAFAGGGTQFQTAGIPIDRDALAVEAGMGWQATRDIGLEIAYTGQVGGRAEDHGVKGSFLWKF